MRLIIFLIAFMYFSVYSFADSPSWTTPSKVNVMAFAVNDYSHYYHNLSSLQRSVLHKNAFVDSLFSALDVFYPSLPKYAAHREDSSATRDAYRNPLTYFVEFVFFSGHGNQQRLSLYDYPVNVSSGCGSPTCLDDQYGKIYNGATRWAIFDACLVLNVNQSDKLSWPLTVDAIDSSKFNMLRSVFAGVHALLGFYSISWEDSFWDNGQFKATEDLYRYFVYYFIEDNQNIWNSFNMANADFAADFYYNLGLKPAIAFLSGFDENDYFHDTSGEMFTFTCNQPIPITGTLELYIMYNEYGSPVYY